MDKHSHGALEGWLIFVVLAVVVGGFLIGDAVRHQKRRVDAQGVRLDVIELRHPVIPDRHAHQGRVVVSDAGGHLAVAEPCAECGRASE